MVRRRGLYSKRFLPLDIERKINPTTAPQTGVERESIMKKMILFATFGLIGIIAASPFTAQAGGDVKESSVNFVGGNVVDLFGNYKQCLAEKAECDKKFKDCDEGLEQCQENLDTCYDICPNAIETCKGSDCPPKPEKKSEKIPHKIKKKCWSHPRPNGLVGHWYGLEDLCGIEAEMDGRCMTGKQAYDGLLCLLEKVNDVEDDMAKLTYMLQSMEKMTTVIEQDPVDTSAFVMKAELQTEVKKLMGWINSILAANAERDEKIAGLEEELLKLRDKLSELEKRLRVIEACIWVDPEYEGFETDYEGNILPESYAAVCGILGHIPMIEKRLDELEKKVDGHLKQMQPLIDEFEECRDPMNPMFEDPRDFAKACPLTRHKMCKVMDREEALILVDGDEKRLEAICSDPDAKPEVSHAFGPKLHMFGSFTEEGFNTFFIGAILEWKGLVVKRDGKDLIGFSVFAGALGGVTSDSDPGIAYGARFYLWPGAQDVFGLFLGYEGLSSGIFEAEHPLFVPDPNNGNEPVYTGDIDPDRQHHAGLLGISLGHLWPIREKNGKLHSLGIEGSIAAGLGWQDDALNSGLVGVFSADFGVVYSLTW